jgi:hypothetical protein
MSTTTIGRLIGALFLGAFAFYLAGGALAESGSTLGAGALLMFANSVAVAAIGVLALRVIGPAGPAYLVARVAEAVLLTVGIVFLLTREPFATAANGYCFQLAMLSLGLGSLPFCTALRREGLVPGWLAVWGVVGYAVFALGAAAEILGHSVGVVLSAPGGLFEVTLGALLLVRGLPTRRPAVAGVPRDSFDLAR